MLPPDRARSRSPDLWLLSGVKLPALLAQVVAFQAVTSSYDRSAGLWRAPGGDRGHGSALGDIAVHRSLVGAEPVEQAEDQRAEAEVDEQDGQRLRDAVAVEVDRVVQQDVAVAGRQVRPDVPPESRQERVPGGPPASGVADQDDHDHRQQRAGRADQFLQDGGDERDHGDDQRADRPHDPELTGGVAAQPQAHDHVDYQARDDREREEPGGPPAVGRLAGRGQQEGRGQCPADEQGDHHDALDQAERVLGGQRNRRVLLHGEFLPGALGRLLEPQRQERRGQVAAGRDHDQLVGGARGNQRAPDRGLVDPVFDRRFVRVMDDLEGDGLLGRAQHRGRPGDTERQVGRLGGVPGTHVGGREQALHEGGDPQGRQDRDHGPPAARRVGRAGARRRAGRRAGYGQVRPRARVVHPPARAGGGRYPGGADPAQVDDHGRPGHHPQEQDDQRGGDVVGAVVEHVADQVDRVLRWEDHPDVPPVARQQVAAEPAGAGQADEDQQDQDQRGARFPGQSLDRRGPQRDRRGDQPETWQQRPEMAAGVRADARAVDQVGQQRPGQGIADQDVRGPRRRRRPGRREDEHGGEKPADEHRQQQQRRYRADRIAGRQRRDRLDRDRAAQLMRRGQERRLYVKLGEEALRRDHDQRVAGFAGDVRAVQLAVVDRGHRRRLAGIVRQVQPQLRIRCHRGGHRRRSTGHAKGHTPRHRQLLRADQAQRENGLQHQHGHQRDQDLPDHVTPARLTSRRYLLTNRRRCLLTIRRYLDVSQLPCHPRTSTPYARQRPATAANVRSPRGQMPRQDR